MADRPTERRRRRAGRRRQESAKDKARRQDAELDAKCLATPPFHPGGLVAVFATQTSEAYNAFKGTPIEATATTHLHAVTRHLDRFERGMIYPREAGCELTEN